MAAWRPGFRSYNMDPVKVAGELRRLRKKCKGEIRADDVVDAARSARSEMHKYIFEKTDAEAAQEHRLHRARTVLVCIVETQEVNGTAPVQTYHLDRTRARKDRQYKPYRATEDILTDPDSRAALLQDALAELIAFQRKYRQLQELAIVFREVENVLTTAKPY